MNDYREVRLDLDPCSEDATDYMAAMLGEIGYESFVPDEKGMLAYVKEEDYDGEALKDVLNEFPFDCIVTCSSNLIPGQDWNKEWEKNYFKPIVVGEGKDSVAIHSSFHTDVPPAAYDIVVDPKMAFGTGHHATTSLMLAALLDLDLAGKAVIDMGTGTGILAMLAAMRGANPVTGIEIDAFAYENAVENTKLNSLQDIKIINGDALALEGLAPADVFIANINRNIIIGDLPSYVKALKPGGIMLLSGFYEHDIPEILKAAEPLGLSMVDHEVKGDNWTRLKLRAV
ncbi:MAG: 50S ribosomal protein L11 methyltransferase [Clostridium sp.]|nr:50S ribosomal protein L11 methyltransferase [Clostridium sp.]